MFKIDLNQLPTRTQEDLRVEIPKFDELNTKRIKANSSQSP